jgi:proline-specific peptidase
MSVEASVREGHIPFRGHHTWYRVVGDGEAEGRLPLVALHGGPGGTHDYLESLGALARRGRRVVFYDQLGCGRSDRPDDPSLWTVDLFVEELDAVREALGLDRIHLFGSSWGGMLAMEYALRQKPGLASLIVASSPASMRQWVKETARLRSELPQEVQETLSRHEEAGTTGSQEYEEACMVFYRRHVCRLEEWPDYVERSMMALPNQVYLTMNGPSEFHVVGTLKDWDIRDRLGEIELPTLVTSGRYDEATPEIAGTVHRGIRGSDWVVFEESSHMAHAEEPERYLEVLEDFLRRRVEGV